MSNLDHVAYAVYNSRFNRAYVGLLVDDIAEDQMTALPGGLKSHPAWHLGHLAHSIQSFAVELGNPATLPESFKPTYGMGSEPTSNRADYGTKAELLAALDEQISRAHDAARKLTEADLAKEHPNEQMRPFFPTVGHFVIMSLCSHPSIHAGQIATWRQAQGLPQAFERLDSFMRFMEAAPA